MSGSDLRIADNSRDPGRGDQHTDMRVDSPHVADGERRFGDHFNAVHGRTLSLAQRAGNEPTESSDATIRLQQLRTQAVQLADHLSSRQRELDRREAELNHRATEFDVRFSEAQKWLSEREAAIERLRRQWIEERKKAEAELEAARRRMDQQYRRDFDELSEKRRALEVRSEQVDQASIAVQQVWEEVARVHREALQLHLANEELAARLAPSAPPERLDRTLKEIRARIAEEYRRANDALARKQEELLAIRRVLSAQHRKLIEERDRLYRLAAQLAADQRHGSPSQRTAPICANNAQS